ncbi:hypothetical protein KZZ04_18790, partial [Pseudoalteromonas sp. CR1]|nr:hypothetical protein [Pseudoalteromonas sp. CR1]
APGSGTRVTCTFPTDHAGEARRAPPEPKAPLPPPPPRKPILTLQPIRPEPPTSDRRTSP